LYFCLDENKKWHKEHLNKKANSSIISEAIGEVTGKKYLVKFELGKVDAKNQVKNHKPRKDTVKSKDISVKNDVKIEDKETVNKDAGAKGEDGEDMLKYFEKKFEIKE
jgi:hypothetical protein